MGEWTPIDHLFALCGPAHIARLVVARIVDAFYLMLQTRRHANVCEKSIERLSPRSTHFDTASAVINETWTAAVMATTFDFAPTAVFLRLASPVRRGIEQVCFEHIDRVATTALSWLFGATQRRSDNGDGVAAFALAQPQSLPVERSARAVHNTKSTECFPGKVYCYA